MKKSYYNLKGNDVLARSYNCPISFKFSVELSRELRNKHYKQAIKYLEDIMALKRHVPIVRYNSDVAHRKGQAISGVKSGRYPVKVAKYFKKVFEMAKANADYKGLDSDKKDLIVKGCVVSQGIKRYSYQTKGRRRLRRDQTTNIEVVLVQQGKFVNKKKEHKKIADKKKKTKPEEKDVEKEKAEVTQEKGIIKEQQKKEIKAQKELLNKEMQKKHNL